MTITAAFAVQRQNVGPRKRLWRTIGGRRVHRNVFAADIEELRRRALLWLANGHFVFGHRLGDFRCRIIQITSQNRVFRTHDDTSRLQSEIHFVRTVMAFGCCPRFWIDIDGIVWTRLHTGFAPYANVWIELYNTVVALVHGRYRTYAHTGWIGAVVAPRYLKRAGHIRVLPRLHTLYPGALNAERHFVLTLTRCGARVAPDTSIVIDQKTVIHTDANSI